MARQDGNGAGAPTGVSVHGAGAALLAPSLRRDLADLNLQFLELGLRSEFATDPRFAWSDPVARTLQRTTPDTRASMAGCPFALFRIALPAPMDSGPRVPSRVEDGLAGGELLGAVHGACLSFLHAALFVAWRLADSAPLAARLALGLSPAAELALNELCLSELTRLAARPGVLRPRWAAHPGFWELLIGAAEGLDGYTLQQAHCVGICLLDDEFSRDRSGDVPAARRRGPR